MKLLKIAPAISGGAVADLDAVEARIGRKLPASVREWYSLEGACGLLRQYSNDDWPVDVHEFGRPVKDTRGGGPHDLLARGLVVFRYENQAVCVWAFGPDGTDDPPTYVDFDSQFTTWTKCAPTFSEHLYAWMWDHAEVINKHLAIEATNAPLSEAALGFLRDNFDTGPERMGGRDTRSTASRKATSGSSFGPAKIRRIGGWPRSGQSRSERCWKKFSIAIRLDSPGDSIPQTPSRCYDRGGGVGAADPRRPRAAEIS